MSHLLAVVALVAGLAQPSTVIADGHVDLGPRFVDGRWTVQIRDDSAIPPTWRTVSDVVLRAADTAKVEVPADPAYAFLGAPGTSVWLLPQVQRAGILWPGWNTQDPEVATKVGGEVTWKLHGVTGPGVFVLFLNGEFGAPQVVFDGAKPFPQETGIEPNSHVHGNWSFTATGLYVLDIEMSAGDLVDRTDLRIQVGDGAVPEKPVVTAAAVENKPVWFWWPIGGGALVVVVAGFVALRRKRG
jgi:putative ABC transporter-associated repeat protein